MIVRGSGPPFVIVPGLDGHSSWMRPAIDALARHFTVIALSLCGEPDSDADIDETLGFDAQLASIDRALERLRIDRAAICGVSYGGWIALRYAAYRQDRVTSLVLVSAPPPGFEPTPTQVRQLRSPLLSMPDFVLGSPGRVFPEIAAALPTWRERVQFTAGHLSRLARTGMSPRRMAMRMRVASRIDFFDACHRIDAPTLVVTGEPGLDHIVPVEATRRYLTLISGAEHVTLHRTGHMGSLTHANVFADVVQGFMARRVHAHETQRSEHDSAEAEGRRPL